MRSASSAIVPATVQDAGPRASSRASAALTRMLRVLQALVGTNDEDVQIAQVYLRHRPIADVNELRLVATGVARMRNSEAQVRALDTLARTSSSDRQSLDALTHLFPVAKSLDVQRAIAGILIRADYRHVREAGARARASPASLEVLGRQGSDRRSHSPPAGEPRAGSVTQRRNCMKLYYHPASTTSRPIMLFAAEQGAGHRLQGRRSLHRRASQGATTAPSIPIAWCRFSRTAISG